MISLVAAHHIRAFAVPAAREPQTSSTSVFPNPTILGLNKFEDIRYPDANQHAMAVAAEWSGPAGEVTAYGGITTPKQYTLVVSEIDDLIADAFKMSNWNPSGFMGTNPAALEAITKRNAHSEFLTKR